MLLNFSKIRTQKVEDPVAKHFCQKNHCVKNFKVIGIEKTGNGDKIYRETKESHIKHSFSRMPYIRFPCHKIVNYVCGVPVYL
jgi:hypothetical protein